MLKVDIYGEGPNVVLLHGCPVPPESLQTIREQLEKSYRVVVPNLTGIGLNLTESLTPIEKTLEAHGVKTAALVGHSLGACRAFQIAHSGVIEVTKVVGLGPLVTFPDDRLAQYAELADAVEADTIDAASVALSLWYPAPFLEANPHVETTVRRWFAEMGKQVVIDTLRVEVHGPDLHPILDELDVPVYLRVGALDMGTPPAWAEAIAARLSDVHLDIVSNVGHFLHDEDPDATLAAIETFLTTG